MAQGREDEALKVLQWIYKTNTKEDPVYYPVKKLIPEHAQKDKIEGASKGL